LLVAILLTFHSASAELFVPASGSDTILTSAGDDTTFALGPLPPGFLFFGTVPGSFVASVNGNLNVTAAGFIGGDALPNGRGAAIAPFWDDLIIPGGDLRMNDTVPGQLTVIWNGVSAFGQSGASDTFEAVVFGTGNFYGLAPGTIILSYGNLTPASNGSVSRDGDAEVGLNQGDGVQYSTHAPLVGGSIGGNVNDQEAIAMSNTFYVYTPIGNSYVVTVPEPGAGAFLISSAFFLFKRRSGIRQS
jgi:hypothetical protein